MNDNQKLKSDDEANGKAEFITESDELSTKIFEFLLRFEMGPTDAESIAALYREIHTLKGLAQLFGIEQVAVIADEMETALEPVRIDQKLLTPDLTESLIARMGTVSNLITELRATKVLSNGTPSLVHVQDGETPMAVPEDAFDESRETQNRLTLAPVTATPVSAGAVNAAATTPAATSHDSAMDTVRVPVSVLDKLMLLVGEIVLVRNEVKQHALKEDDFEFSNLSQRLDIVTSEIQGEVMKTRMQPIGTILTKFQRVVRDLARDLNKKLELTTTGIETELDKTLLEAVKDPLMHIVRNSCDHGIESAEQRRALGKPEVGQISIRAFHEGSHVFVEISDDGRGLNQEKLIAKAIERGILTPEKAQELTTNEINALILAPGFSTAAEVTNVSGRGVGMDVVKSNIEKIGGIVEIESKLGERMTIRLKIPLTLAIVPAMIVRSGKERFAIPQSHLVELLRLQQGIGHPAIEELHGRQVYRLRGRLLPLVNLAQIFTDGPLAETENQALNIVVLEADQTAFGLIVDEVQDTADIVVKPLNAFLKSIGAFSGASVLGDGRISLILDIFGLARRQSLALNMKGVPTTETVDETQNESQEFLKFRLRDDQNHYAIPLALVHRLEEFDVRRIEISGNQRVVRYRDSLLPVLSLSGIVNSISDEDAPPSLTVSLIVVQKSERYFGIEVREILDVLATKDTMDESVTDRPAILGNLMSKDSIIVVVDILRVIDDHLAKNPHMENRKTAIAKTKRKILFAEDTNFFRKHVRSALENAGYEVTTANDGHEAFELLKKSDPKRFDLLLSDIEMPKMNGFELVKSVRAHTVWKHLPAVALTTRVTPQHIEDGLKAGFNEYLEKMKVEVLLNTLDAVLNDQKRNAA